MLLLFFSLISLFFFRLIPLLLLFLSFGGGFVETNTNTSKNKSLFVFFGQELQLTDYLPEI